MDGFGVNVLQVKVMGEYGVEDLGKRMVEVVSIEIQVE